MQSVIARTALLVTLAACGDSPAHVRLVNVNPTPCGKPTGATAIRVIAYTSTIEVRKPVPLDATVELDGLPADTEQLGIEVVGDAGAVLATGKTGPIAFGALADGVAIPVFMAPEDGFCRTGELAAPRVAPGIARAGDGVLVVGGDDAAGLPLSTAAYYDPHTATFTELAVPSLDDPVNGLRGAALAELPDGRVVLTGTSRGAITIFDPTTRTFTMPGLLPEPRAYHGAIAPDADHVFVIGGCAGVVGGACSGPRLLTSFDYPLDVAGQDPGPVLPTNAQRLGAQIFDVGISGDGVHRYVLVGGAGDPGVADRFALSDAATQTIAGIHAQTAALDGGALVTAFEPDGTPQTGAAGVVPPDGGVVPIALAPLVDGARLALLEDGTVVAMGGDPAGQIAHYVPTTNAWAQTAPPGDPPGMIAAPVMIRLDDGSLLVLGGRPASATAWIYRPSLVGPQSGSVVALPDGSTSGVLTASDPSTVSRAGGAFTLTSAGARALVGGPRLATGSVKAAVRIRAGGVDLIARQLGPGQALVAELVPGAPARVVRLDAGAPTTLCEGSPVGGFDPAASRAIGFAVAGRTATITLDELPIATCDLGAAPAERGAWGIAADGVAPLVDVVTITVARQ